MSNPIILEDSHLQAIAKALVGHPGGLSHREISHLLTRFAMDDDGLDSPKWVRVFNAFAILVNRTQSSNQVFWFVRESVQPARFSENPDDFEIYRHSVNIPLALVGASVDQSGQMRRGSRAKGLPDAERRARELRSDLTSRGIHADVLTYCRAELLGDDYFHAVLEATKSVAHKLRTRTGLADDGASLVQNVFGGDSPLLVINGFRGKSEKDEQKGFCNLLIGMFGMFRNPTAHEARIIWQMSKEDAEDLLTIVSLAHRRIDKATLNPRV